MTEIKVIFEYSKGCRKHINQDAYGINNNIFWVIDGATEVFPNSLHSKSGDVHWVVNMLSKELRSCNATMPLKSILKKAIRSMREKAVTISPKILTMPANILPTYAIVCVKVLETSLEYLCLGDCSLFVSNNPCTRITDNRIEPVHLLVNATKEQYKDNLQLYNSKVLETVRSIKQYINVEGGYWIGSYDPEIVDHAIVGKVSIGNGDRFLLCSDGFRPSIDEANLVHFNPLDIFNKNVLKTLLEEQEKSEIKFLNHSGIDIIDDKTVLLVQV